MTFFVRKPRIQKGFDHVAGKGHAYNAGAENEHIDIVVLYSLMRGISVVAHASANAWHFVRSDTSTYTAPTDEDAALCFTLQNSQADFFREIGIVGRILVEGADIEHFVTERAKEITHRYFQLESGMV